ncbi:MAG: substrate-binding periplasmic protein [Ktedonobacterales bacterium]
MRLFPRSFRGWTWRAAALAALSLTMVLSACGAGNATSTSTKTSTGALTIGNAGTLQPGVLKWGEDSTGGMPYIVPKDSLNTGADYYGFEYDIMKAMGQLMNVQQQPTQVTWSNWPQGLQAQQYDFFMNGLELTTDNLQSAQFSIPYYVYTQSIVVLSSNTTINSFNDLAGKSVETGTGYKAQQILEAYNADPTHTSKINIVATDFPTPFTDLLSGRVDAEFLDTPIAKWYGQHDPSGKYKIVGGDLNPGYYAIGFSPSNPNTPVLMKEVNLAIEQLWLNGTLQKIYQTGGANNAGPNNQSALEPYDLWNSVQGCVTNFFPVNPGHVTGCPNPYG